MANLSDFLPIASGGAKYPRKLTFTSSTSWQIPTAIKNNINDNGFCSIRIVMAGGGGSSRSGEIIDQIYEMNSTLYSSSSSWSNPSIPEIPIVVGASGGNTGLGISAGTGTIINTANGLGNYVHNYITPGAGTSYSNNYPLLHSMQLFYKGPENITSFSYTGTTQPSRTNGLLEWSTPSEFDGTISFAYNGGGSGSGNGTISFDIANNRFDVYHYNANYSQSADNFSVTYSADDILFKARNGNHSDYLKFKNDPSNSIGYSGYGRYSGTGYGSNGQPGIIEIYYFD